MKYHIQLIESYELSAYSDSIDYIQLDSIRRVFVPWVIFISGIAFS